MELVKMGSYWSRVNLQCSVTNVFLRERSLDTGQHTGRNRKNTVSTWGWPQGSQGDRPGTHPSFTSQQEPTLPTPWSWTAGLQNCEAISFCWLSSQFVVFYYGSSRKKCINFQNHFSTCSNNCRCGRQSGIQRPPHPNGRPMNILYHVEKGLWRCN